MNGPQAAPEAQTSNGKLVPAESDTDK
jgi:hypothetical protein